MSSAIIAQIAVIAVGALAIAVLMRRLSLLVPRRRDSPFEAALAPSNEPIPVFDEFASIRRTVDGARFSAFDVHYTLRPLLRDLAAWRLRVRRGIELDDQPELASEVLGAEAYALLREGRPAPSNYRRPGMSVQAIERVVKVLESI